MPRLRRPRSPAHLLRQVTAGVLVCLALVLALRPPPPGPAGPTEVPTAAVTVAAADLSAGAVLAAGDLVTTQLPEEAVPAGTTADPAELTGRLLAAPLRAGEPVTDVRLVGPGLTALLPAGQVAAPVRLADLAVAGLAAPGDRVDVLATAPDAADAEVVVSGALVLSPSTTTDAGAVDAAPAAGLLLLAVDSATGARLAAAAASDTLSVTLAPP